MDVLNIFGRDFVSMTDRRRKYWLERARSFWRLAGFPYPNLSEFERRHEFELVKSVCANSIFSGNLLVHSTLGLRLANSFHPQIWRVREHGRSPVELFEDDRHLVRALEKAARFWPNRRCWNAQCLRSVLRIMFRIRVSNFRPTVARALLDRFSGPSDAVLDFSAGYGGRLLGALTLNRTYVGVDPAAAQVIGLKSMSADLRPQDGARVRIVRGCAEDILPRLSSGEFSVVFSSPPYFDCERYSDESTQSYIRYPVYEAWRDRFLTAVLGESHRVLARGGRLILNVADFVRAPVARDAESICRRWFGAPRAVFRMLISSGPVDRGSAGRPYRWEPIYVFKKA